MSGGVNEERKTIPFFPDHLKTEAWVTMGVLGIAAIVGVISVFNPIGLGEPADPMVTPAHTKPEWYFLFLYQLLKYVPKTTGAVIPVIGIILLALWPFLDRRVDDREASRRRVWLVVIVMLIIIGLTMLGELQ